MLRVVGDGAVSWKSTHSPLIKYVVKNCSYKLSKYTLCTGEDNIFVVTISFITRFYT